MKTKEKIHGVGQKPLKKGLSDGDAARSRETHGSNELSKKAKDVISVGDIVTFSGKCGELQNNLVFGRSFDISYPLDFILQSHFDIDFKVFLLLIKSLTAA